MAPTAHQRSRALMAAAGLSFVAYVAPLPFAAVPYAVFLLLLPFGGAWISLVLGLPLARRGLGPLPSLVLPPLVLGLLAGAVIALVAPEAGSGLVAWGGGSGLAAGLGAWLVMRR